VSGATDSPDPLLEALWTRVIEAWSDDKAHAALLAYASGAKRLPDIAARYRERSLDPDHAATAKKQLDAIVESATVSMLAMKMPRPERPPLAMTLSAFGVCLVLLTWLAYAMWGRH
jgi:hypothetical protein